MKIGFIGVGNIGAPIALQLLAAGHALVVHDLRQEAAQADVAAAEVVEYVTRYLKQKQVD